MQSVEPRKQQEHRWRPDFVDFFAFQKNKKKFLIFLILFFCFFLKENTKKNQPVCSAGGSRVQLGLQAGGTQVSAVWNLSCSGS